MLGYWQNSCFGHLLLMSNCPNCCKNRQPANVASGHDCHKWQNYVSVVLRAWDVQVFHIRLSHEARQLEVSGKSKSLSRLPFSRASDSPAMHRLALPVNREKKRQTFNVSKNLVFVKLWCKKVHISEWILGNLTKYKWQCTQYHRWTWSVHRSVISVWICIQRKNH